MADHGSGLGVGARLRAVAARRGAAAAARALGAVGLAVWGGLALRALAGHARWCASWRGRPCSCGYAAAVVGDRIRIELEELERPGAPGPTRR